MGTGAGRSMAEGTIRKAVADFALVMEQKLREKDHKSGWRDESLADLFRLLLGEVGELDDAIDTYNDTPEYIELDELVKECADVANFAMMIADAARSRHGRTT